MWMTAVPGCGMAASGKSAPVSVWSEPEYTVVATP